MNKTFKRVLSVFLCVLMAFSTAAYTFAASEIICGPEYFLETSDAENAKIVFDKVDELLKEQNIYKKITLAEKTFITPEVAITLDLRSVDGLCDTLDGFKDLMDGTLWKIAKPLIGDLKDLNLKNWQTGMKRTKDDVKILNTLLQILDDNAGVIAKLVDGSLDLGGIISNFVDIKSLLGADGVYGMVKGMLVGLLYDENSAEYKAAYAKKLDKFVYEDVIGLLSNTDGALPGFTMNESSTVDNLLISALASAWTKYIVPAFKSINVDWSTSENEALKKISGILNLDGSKFDYDSVVIDTSKSFASQINDILGAVVKLFYSKANWTSGGIDKLAGNFDTLYKDLAAEMGVAADPLAIAKFVIGNLEVEGLGDYVGDYNSWTSMENAVAAVLRNTAKKTGIPVTSDSKATYENILGDYLTYAVDNVIPLSYKAGSGTSIWTVLNDIANVYLFDKGFAKAFNLPSSITKSSTIYEKLDAVIAMTGIFNGLTPAKDYKSENFIKGILDAVFKFDFATAVNMTATRFLGDFGEKVAVKVLYDAVYTFLKTWFSKEIIVPYATSTPLDNAISNSSLKTTVGNLLSALNSKKSVLVSPVLYIGALALASDKLVAFSDTDVKVADASYTGKAIVPQTITAKGITLTNGKDFEITSIKNNVKVGTATLSIKFIGKYKGEASGLTFKISLNAPTNLKFSSVSQSSVTASWTKASGASGYEISWTDGKTTTTKTTTSASYKLTGLKANTTYTVKVRSYNADKAYSATVSAKATTPVAQVTGLQVSSVTDTTATLKWTAVSGATSYNVYYSKDNKTWSKVTSTKNSCTVSKLSAYTKYYFKVAAVKGSTAGAASSVVNATTLLAKVTGLNVTTTDTTATLKWTAVKSATTYNVYYSKDGKKWTKVSVKTNSAKISKLTANTTYYFKVEAVKSSVIGPACSSVKAATTVAKVTGLKVSAVTDTTATLKWTKVAGATSYNVYYSKDGKKWTKVTAKSNSAKISKLAANSTYSFKVTAVKDKVAGPESSTVKATTTVAKVTGLKVTVTSTTATLKWTKVSGATTYTVSYSKDGKKWTKVTVKTNSAKISKLTANTTYYFKVAAVKSKVAGPDSSTVKTATAVAKVTGLKASKTTGTTVKLTWTKVSGASGYEVYRNGKKVGTIKKGSTVTFTDSKLKKNTTYKYTVKAYKVVSKKNVYGDVSATLSVKTAKK
ncbi:MAG: fibronectin type III domain-containing protein [Acutalibacteraceae bacterium]